VEEVRSQINEWVEKQTAGKIKDLVRAGMLDAMSRLVLTNVIYFRGSWEHEFIENATNEAPFWTAPNEQHSIPMMRQTANFSYGEFDDLQVLEMPYRSASHELWPLQDKERLMQAAEIPGGGSELAMMILLPRRIDGLKEIEARSPPSMLRNRMNLQSCQVEAQIPKFRIGSSFMLSESLQSMGIRRAFSMEDADFSRMADDPTGLYISAAVHKAFVDVNEKGTEAAAATAMVMRPGCAMRQDPPKTFRADHPFLFLIRDRNTRLIHFMGRMTGCNLP
jgi:serpin B